MEQKNWSDQDYFYMEKALELAWNGRFSTSPNPRVGCVIVRGEQIVGQGFHVKAGEPHAEVHALRQAGAWAHGATAYVTLEPCSHFGRTPPCAKGLIEAGLARVVVAMKDPNPLVAGKGLAMLEQAGIQVECGLLEHQARELNRGFLSRIERKRPFVKMKIGASLDGKTALSNGQSQWITGNLARTDVQKLRAESCAVLTGIGTILADNPLLNVRDFPTLRQPIRIILDSQFQLKPYSQLKNLKIFESANEQNPVWVMTLQPNWDEIGQIGQGINIIQVSANQTNRIDLPNLLEKLAELGIGELMIEAGSTLNTAFLELDLVDEIVYYQSPKILGENAKNVFSLPENPSVLTEQPKFQTVSVEKLGNDVKWILRRAEN